MVPNNKPWAYYKAPSSPKEYVYLGMSNRLKIGRTWNLRLRSLQHARKIKMPFRILAYLPLENPWDATETETRLLRIAKSKYATRGEWFPIDNDIIKQFLSEKGVVICL